MMGDLDLHPSLFLFVPARRKLERGYVDARDVPPTASQDRAPYRPGTLSGEGLLRRERALVFHVFIFVCREDFLPFYFPNCHRSRLCHQFTAPGRVIIQSYALRVSVVSPRS